MRESVGKATTVWQYNFTRIYYQDNEFYFEPHVLLRNSLASAVGGSYICVMKYDFWLYKLNDRVRWFSKSWRQTGVDNLWLEQLLWTTKTVYIFNALTKLSYRKQDV